MKSLVYKLNDIQVVELEGALEVTTLPTVLSVMEELFDETDANILLDLTLVPFIDADAVECMVYFHQQLIGQGRQLYLVCLAGQPRDVLRELHLDQAVPCYETVREFIHASL